MKIAHITPTFPPSGGGTGNAAYHLAVEAARHGHEVTVFTPLYDRDEVLSFEGIKVIRLKTFVKYGKAAFVPQLLSRLKGFDILHLHYPFFGGAEAVWLRRRADMRQRLIVTYHMDVVGKGLQSLIFKFYTRFFLKKIILSADKVIVSSIDYAMHSYIRDFADPGRIVEIPFGIDSGYYPKKKDISLLERHNILSHEKVVLFLGSLEYFKGVDRLLKSIPLLKGDFKVVIAGKGALIEELKALAKDLCIDNKVIFAGFIKTEDLINYYSIADVFILPSVDRTEAFGIVLIEAMACGKPVVASNLPGIRTVVEDGVDGYLTVPGDVTDIARKLQLFIDNNDLGITFGQKGLEKVHRKYLWERVGESLNNTYKQVVEDVAQEGNIAGKGIDLEQ